MNSLRMLTFLAAVLLSGCATTSTRQYRAREEEIIREAVLLERLLSRDTNRLVFVYFKDSALNPIEPSDAVIARIRTAGIPARKASESTTDDHTVVIDKATGKQGVLYYAGVLKWSGNSEVEVIEGSTYASLWGGFTEFIMRKKDGKWVKTRTKRIVTI